MPKILLALFLSLLVSLPVFAEKTIFGLVQRSTFVVSYDDVVGTQIGTAFCAPSEPTSLITAAHVIGPGLEVYDFVGEQHEVLAVHKDDKVDVAKILVKDPVCKFSNLKWASKDAPVGTRAWLYGYGGAFDNPLLVTGIISGPVGTLPPHPIRQVAQLNALYGHSGGPVLNDDGEVIGMLVGGFRIGADMNSIIPVEMIKKAIK